MSSTTAQPLLSLAKIIRQAADNEDWSELQKQLNQFQKESLLRRFVKQDKIELEASLKLINDSIDLAKQRQVQIEKLIGPLGS